MHERISEEIKGFKQHLLYDFNFVGGPKAQSVAFYVMHNGHFGYMNAKLRNRNTRNRFAMKRINDPIFFPNIESESGEEVRENF